MLRLALLLSALCAVTYGCPTIISKSGWEGESPRCTLTAMTTPVPYVIIHHTHGVHCTSQSECTGQVKNIQDHHMYRKGWCDIGYSFLVGEDGNVYEGRGWKTVGAHAVNYNSKSIGISIMGSYTDKNPNSDAQNAVKSLISCGVCKGYIRSNYVLKGHCNVAATSCPGNTFYNLIKDWPHFQA